MRSLARGLENNYSKQLYRNTRLPQGRIIIISQIVEVFYGKACMDISIHVLADLPTSTKKKGVQLPHKKCTMLTLKVLGLENESTAVFSCSGLLPRGQLLTWTFFSALWKYRLAGT